MSNFLLNDQRFGQQSCLAPRQGLLLNMVTVMVSTAMPSLLPQPRIIRPEPDVIAGARRPHPAGWAWGALDALS